MQAAVDLLAVAIPLARWVAADKRYRLHDESGTVPLWVLAEQQQSRKVQRFASSKAEVVEELPHRRARPLERFLHGRVILRLKELPKMTIVEVVESCAIDGHLVRVHKTCPLQQTLNFLARCHSPLVRAGLDPEYAAVIRIGLRDPFAHGHDHDEIIADGEVLRFRVDGRADVVCGRVGDELIQAADIVLREPVNAALVINTDRNPAPRCCWKMRPIRPRAIPHCICSP